MKHYVVTALAALALATGCNNAATPREEAGTPSVPATLGPLTITGTAAGWTRGAGTVRDSDLSDSSKPRDLAQGSIDASGALSITLPGPEVMDALALGSLADLLCPPQFGLSSITSTPPDLALHGAGLLRFFPAGSSTSPGILSHNTSEGRANHVPGDASIVYLYAVTPGRARGKCLHRYGTTSVDITLGRGWNTVLQVFTGPPDSRDSYLTNGSVPAKAAWHFNLFPTR